jgi:hypothetical protein
VRRDELREAHGLKVHEACGKMLLQNLSRFRQGLTMGIRNRRETRRGAVISAL